MGARAELRLSRTRLVVSGRLKTKSSTGVVKVNASMRFRVGVVLPGARSTLILVAVERHRLVLSSILQPEQRRAAQILLPPQAEVEPVLDCHGRGMVQ